MKAIPLNPETEPVARRLVWFEPPEEALADPVRFMAYAMARATHDDMKVIRRYVNDADFQEALDKALPGIIDPRSWAYWKIPKWAAIQPANANDRIDKSCPIDNFDVSLGDPITLTAVSLLLIFTALTACYFPARHATHIDPVLALRSD